MGVCLHIYNIYIYIICLVCVWWSDVSICVVTMSDSETGKDPDHNWLTGLNHGFASCRADIVDGLRMADWCIWVPLF